MAWLGHSGCTAFSHTFYGGDQPKNMYNWLIHPNPIKHFLMPSPELPKLLYKLEGEVPHYLFPHALPPHLQESEQEPLQYQPEYEPYAGPHGHEDMDADIPEQPQNPPPPNFFQKLLEGQQQLLAGYNQMNTNYMAMGERLNQVQEEQRAGFQRMEELREADKHRYEEDQRRLYGPMYSYIAHQGSFQTMVSPPPPPSWYDPTHWGNFGGSSSGGGGYDGGDGGDGGTGGGFDSSFRGGFRGNFYGGEGGH
ncbi:unnamed protein product [Cuscuta europaea]|uniref:Uncharacterized protein n=1 Tax=Cuscuta europaea TaxID=41803 RepID=A0A9P0YXY7_CUSEU|nr:unnamed protein product [Cuscuta europaea]